VLGQQNVANLKAQSRLAAAGFAALPPLDFEAIP
jgi:hypothetical protein